LYVGIVQLTIVVAHSHSLKEKRMVVRRIKDRVRERVGVVVNEVGEQDSWQRSELGCAVTSSDRQKALSLLDEVVRVAQSASDGQVVAVAKDAWTFEVPAEPIEVSERTGAGDKAGADESWIPDAWRDED
jgi:uncharacterized protein YlxP (DUF503 family)